MINNNPYNYYYCYDRKICALLSRDRITYSDEEANHLGFDLSPTITINGEDLISWSVELHEIMAGDHLFIIERVRKTQKVKSTYICHGGITKAVQDGSEVGEVVASHYITINPERQATECSKPLFFVKER